MNFLYKNFKFLHFEKNLLFAYLFFLLFFVSCSSKGQDKNLKKISSNETDFFKMEKTGSLELLYAKEFSADFYGSSVLLKISGGQNFFIISENSSVPKNLPQKTTVLKKPLLNVYLVSSSAMDFVCKLDSIFNLGFSGTKKDGWFIPEAKEAMEKGNVLYAGKYSSPDYELLYSKKCSLAVENTMIYHSPETKEKLEELGIPVLVEKSTYESHPLGRLEWIKLYGILFDKLDEACDFYTNQIEKVLKFSEEENSGKTAAFFYITSNGSVNVRKSGDYISKMIEMAGGKYALCDVLPEDENSLSTMNMQFEKFYLVAADSDILIYNSTVDKNLFNKNSLLEKNPMLADFKAFKENKVYCTESNFFQETTGLADFMEDLHNIFYENNAKLKYIKKIDTGI